MDQWMISKVCFMCQTWLVAIVSDAAISAMQSGLFDFASNWITIPIVNQVIVWGQAIAIVLVIAIRVAVGISRGILSDEIKAPEYLFKSVGAVALIGLMPVFCNLIILAGQTMMHDVLGICGNSRQFVESLDVDWLGIFADTTLNTMQNLTGMYLTTCINNLAGAVALILMVVVFFELLKRQVEMLIVAVVAPWVGIKVATEDSSGDYWSYLTGLFGMCVVQWVQTLFLNIGMQVYTVWVTHAQQNDLFTGVILPTGANGDVWYLLALMIAILLAAINVPSLLDRWTFSGSGGQMLTAMFMRSGMNRAMPNAQGAKAQGEKAWGKISKLK